MTMTAMAVNARLRSTFYERAAEGWGGETMDLAGRDMFLMVIARMIVSDMVCLGCRSCYLCRGGLVVGLMVSLRQLWG